MINQLPRTSLGGVALAIRVIMLSYSTFQIIGVANIKTIVPLRSKYVNEIPH